MSILSNETKLRLRFHPNAYQFVSAALRYTQQALGRNADNSGDDEDAHISGRELVWGISDLAQEKFGLMATTVFRHWGVTSTDDFGRIVFELIERGEMRKTERDQLCDFFDVYDFEAVLDRGYRIDTRKAFQN
jgi:uncharacterized repeat protein (TIGR04138 family)